MRENRQNTLPQDATARFFVQLWFDMVHRNSLDSHRVRCMDALNILRELQDLLNKPFLQASKDNKDAKRSAEECIYILEADKTIVSDFQDHLARVLPLLKEIKDKDEKQQPRSILSYYLKDFLIDLETRYKLAIIAKLESSLLITEDQDEVFHYTGLLLSRLLDEGHSLEGLFGIVTNVFIRYKTADDSAFRRNLELAKRIVTHGEAEYEIVFRLECTNGPPAIPVPILGVQFQAELDAYRQTLKIDIAERLQLLAPRYGILFAKVKVTAREDRSAGLKARDLLDTALDLIRFELQQEVIAVSGEFISVRLPDMTARPFALPSQIPNPEKNILTRDFQQFIDTAEALANRPNLEPESKKKVRSAFRFYRMGRDTPEFENKFLNWWTGLESLVRSGAGSGIFDGVEKMVISILVSNYLSKLLVSFADAIEYCGIKPSASICAAYGITEYLELNPADLFTVLHDTSEQTHIGPFIANYPLLAFRLKRFLNDTKDPGAIKAFLGRHEMHLRWHLHRIWRVCCDIVHSAEYSLNLTLLSANLEFYLKSCLASVLQKLTLNPNIDSLSELYDRIVFEKDVVSKELASGKTNALHRILRDGNV